ncbi:hypothetical protein BDW22DRAFT_1424636 [Trametopsis cervina]|nr:hypothetical protein BDW22DRAFT_1424636 [Trametopsis cervina]
MPRSSKAKKEKAADFSKAKLKLGKGKQTPNNAVDTSFKARSITLPSQSIANTNEKDARAPTTRRKLTFEDLMVHLKHYNSGTRKDAILGLRELFEVHPETMVSSLTPLLNGCVRLIADEDASVRKGLLSFFSWLLRRVPRDDLIPHAQLLLLFTTSAQTHIFPEIRIDAIRWLDLLLEVIPDVVVEGWAQGSNGHGRRVLEGYLGVLNAGTAYNESGDKNTIQATSTASVVLSSASKLVILKSLLSFLSNALSPRSNHPSSSEPQMAWFMSSAFASTGAYKAFDSLLLPRNRTPDMMNVMWQESVNATQDETGLLTAEFATERLTSSWSLGELNDIDISNMPISDSAPESSTGVRMESAYLEHLARTLQPTLVATFLDCAPAVFSPSTTPPDVELQTVCAVASITRCLYGAITLDSQRTPDTLIGNLRALVGHMATYFPFSVYWPIASRRDIKVEQALQDLNLVFCELSSFLVVGAPSSRAVSKRSAKRRAFSVPTMDVPPAHIDSVRNYVVKTLRGGISEQTISMNVASYTSLLPTVWALLNDTVPDHASEVLRAVIEHALRSSPSSAVKQNTIEFLGRLILLETESEYRGRFRLSPQLGVHKLVEEWLTQLPRTLWELGSQNLHTTEVILRLLLRLTQRRPVHLTPTISTSISARLIPFFIIHHSTRGSLPGPFSKLPSGSAIRKLVLDVAFSLCMTGCSDGFSADVARGISGADLDYWVSIQAAST